jgi:putative CocE/NonD family hydrolase
MSRSRNDLIPRAALLSFLPLLGASQGLHAETSGYDKTENMVPMRDGVRLHTLVYRPAKQKEPLPIILLRTPYGVDGGAPRALSEYLKDMADEGYLFAFQDIRGRYKSEGSFVMNRPPRNAGDSKAIDEGTDAFDTIDWLLKNVKENNGRVGMLGISYPGWLTVMALLEPHPALKAASPQAPPADMFLGDDFHHNGAFRLSYGFEYAAMMETSNVNTPFKFDRRDTFEWYLQLGPLANANVRHLKGKIPTWNDFVAHPRYDGFWRRQAVAPLLGRPSVPTLNVGGWWDQEDFYGPLKVYESFEKADPDGRNFLVLGPWNHGGWSRGDGDRLGPLDFGSATGKHFRAKIQAPWFAAHLKDRRSVSFPEATTFRTGSNRWQSYDRWPPKDTAPKRLYARASGRLAFEPPPADENDPGFDTYLSDPEHPVPYRPRPVTPTYPGPEWPLWLVQDQRFVHLRPDVLSYETEPLGEDVTLVGSSVAHLFASTSGSDSDWIVKLIDVYPEEDPKMAGYQLMIANDVFRGRFRKSFENPEPIEPGRVEEYTIDLHWNDHCFKRGHKIMVQVQSTWFPLIDRNPQTFVPNIFQAEARDFLAATQRIFRSPGHATHIEMSILRKPGESPR